MRALLLAGVVAFGGVGVASGATITETGLSYTTSAPADNSTVTLNPNGAGIIMLTDANSQFNPGDSITFNYENGLLTGTGTYLGTFTSDGVIYPFVYSSSFEYDAAGFYAVKTGTFSSVAFTTGTPAQTAIPEPASMALLGAGVLGTLAAARRGRRRSVGAG